MSSPVGHATATSDAYRRRIALAAVSIFVITHRGGGGGGCRLRVSSFLRGLHMRVQLTLTLDDAVCPAGLQQLAPLTHITAGLQKVRVHGGKDLTFVPRLLTYHSACLQTVSGCSMHGSCSISPTKHISPRPKYKLEGLVY